MFMKSKLHGDKSGKENKLCSHAAVEYREGVISVVIPCCDLFILQGIKIIASWKVHRHISQRKLLFCSVLVDTRSECHIYQDTFLVTYFQCLTRWLFVVLNQLLVIGCMVYMASTSRCACINLCHTCFVLFQWYMSTVRFS